MTNTSQNSFAMLFPGVGAQYTGMGKDHYANFSVVRETFSEASDLLGQDMARLCFEEASKAELNRYTNAQLAILTLSTAIYRLLRMEYGLQAGFAAGHSLGEYSALCAAGAFSFADALRLVRERGLILEEVKANVPGDMFWVINLDHALVEQAVEERRKNGDSVYVSAVDAPRQCSISGSPDDLLAAGKYFEGEGAIVFPLRLGGPFHSPLMADAADRLADFLNQIELTVPQFPVIANSLAQPCTTIAEVKTALSKQLSSPVEWYRSMEYLRGEGIFKVLEVGPKTVLKFLLEKYDQGFQAFATDQLSDLSWVREQFSQQVADGMAFIARCLKIAVSTRKNPPHVESYRRDAIEPFRRVQDMYENLAAADRQPSEGQLRAAYEMAASVLRAKNVELRQQKLLLEGLKFDHLLN